METNFRPPATATGMVLLSALQFRGHFSAECMGDSDFDAIRAYALVADEAAFARLIDRHAGWILAAAMANLPASS